MSIETDIQSKQAELDKYYRDLEELKARISRLKELRSQLNEELKFGEQQRQFVVKFKQLKEAIYKLKELKMLKQRQELEARLLELINNNDMECVQVWKQIQGIGGNDELFKVLRKFLHSEFKTVLESINWPNSTEISSDFCEIFPKLMIRSGDELLGFQFLCEHFKLAFQYHFTGKKKTNVISRPEFYLEYTKKFIEKQTEFVLQLDSICDNIGAFKEFKKVIASILKTKVEKDFYKIDNHYEYLYQVLQFEQWFQQRIGNIFYSHEFEKVEFDNIIEFKQKFQHQLEILNLIPQEYQIDYYTKVLNPMLQDYDKIGSRNDISEFNLEPCLIRLNINISEN